MADTDYEQLLEEAEGLRDRITELERVMAMACTCRCAWCGDCRQMMADQLSADMLEEAEETRRETAQHWGTPPNWRP